MNTTSYIIINLLLFSAWHIYLFRYNTIISFAGRLTGAFVLGLTQIIATEMLLGVVLKRLYATQLFFLNVFISAVVLLYAVFAVKRQPGYPDENDVSPFPLNVAKEISCKAAWFITELKKNVVLSAIFALFIISVCWIIFSGYLFPSYTWDALWYHLPIAGYIMQGGAVREIANNSFIDQFVNIFPKNIELFFLWNIIFLKSDAITDLSQLLFAVAGVLSIYGLAIKLKVGKRHALYSSLLFFFTPIVILQSSTNYVDVAVTALFLVAVNFLMADMPCKGGVETRPCNITSILAGLAAGLLLGSKGSGPLFAGILSVALIVREFVRRFKSPKHGSPGAIKAAVKGLTFYLLFFFIPLFLMGGYWYIKNWVVYGNPVHPMEISFMNITIFKGLYQGIIEPAPEIINKLNPFTRPLYVWLENVEYYLYDSRLGGLGPIWPILFLPATVFAVVRSFIKRDYNFMAVFIIVAAAFFMHPRNWNPRYVIFIVGMGALSFGLLLDYFHDRGRVLGWTALLLAVYTFLTANSPCVTPGKIREFIHLPAAERTIGRMAPFNLDLYARQEYGHWIWISRNLSEGETLAYTFEPLFHSPLWNSAYSSKIAYVKSETYSDWLQRLKDSRATYILVRNGSAEDQWIEKERRVFYLLGWLSNAKEKFKVEYSDTNYKIARFTQG
ncbi:MAG: hypothetical protein C4526_11635 [Nitrospiraceae bacterium]|nr:MAG: hypothetical protein C4526_11635 [Nitrospiraceae bacterium]